MRIAVASEHRGFNMKEAILFQLNELHHEGFDFGPPTSATCDYPDYGAVAAKAVSSGQVDRAILIGGTGIGMCIVANKFNGVRAALCHDELSAEMSRRHNDANILVLSANLLKDQLSARMTTLWLATSFEGAQHARRNAKISQYEREIQESRRLLNANNLPQ